MALIGTASILLAVVPLVGRCRAVLAEAACVPEADGPILSPPAWLEPGMCADALTGEPLGRDVSDGTCRVTLPELGAYRLIWIENAGKGAKR